MNNPWKSIPLEVYEEHMKLDSVAQLRALNEIMSEQMASCIGETLMIMGIAGGNGLEHVAKSKYSKVYGVDINKGYLDDCQSRYGDIGGRFEPVCADLMSSDISLPHADSVIANLLIEYVGCESFMTAIERVGAEYVSCVIQINGKESFVSDSPYMSQLEVLQAVHHQIDEGELTRQMQAAGYDKALTKDRAMTNGKILRRIDYKKTII